MKKKVLSILLSAAMVAAMVSGCGSKDEGSSSADSADKTEASSDDAAASDATYEGTIKIGVVGPFSGSSAMVGDTEKKGVELAAKQINENGGINGMTIELIEEDDQQVPRRQYPPSTSWFPVMRLLQQLVPSTAPVHWL